jgi:hypothetical protein
MQDSHLHLRPVLKAGATVAIGDIGKMGADGDWHPRGSALSRLGVEPSDVRSQKLGREVVWDAESGQDVTFKLFAKGETSKLYDKVAQAKARAEITFAKSNSFVGSARGIRLHEAHELDAVVAAIRSSYHRRKTLPATKRWEDDDCIIYAVADVSRYAYLFSEQSESSIAAFGAGKVGPPQAAADLSLSVKFGASSKELEKLSSPRGGAGVFYSAYRLNPKWYKRWQDEPVVSARKVGQQQPTPTTEQVFVIAKGPVRRSAS